MAPAINNKELQILPQVEEIGTLNQKLYRLVSNILEQPEDVKHIHALINQLEEKIVQLKKSTEGYDIDVDMVNQQFDRQQEVPEPEPIDDGKERVYWGPEDAEQLKRDIVDEVVERLRPEVPAEPISNPVNDVPDIQTTQVDDSPYIDRELQEEVKKGKKIKNVKKSKTFNFGR